LNADKNNSENPSYQDKMMEQKKFWSNKVLRKEDQDIIVRVRLLPPFLELFCNLYYEGVGVAYLCNENKLLKG
jgi:hypothetical protein